MSRDDYEDAMAERFHIIDLLEASSQEKVQVTGGGFDMITREADFSFTVKSGPREGEEFWVTVRLLEEREKE